MAPGGVVYYTAGGDTAIRRRGRRLKVREYLALKVEKATRELTYKAIFESGRE